MLSPLSFYDEQEKQAERRAKDNHRANADIKEEFSHCNKPLFCFVDRRGIVAPALLS